MWPFTVHFQKAWTTFSAASQKWWKNLKASSLQREWEGKNTEKAESWLHDSVQEIIHEIAQVKKLMSLYIVDKCTLRSNKEESTGLLRKIGRKNNSFSIWENNSLLKEFMKCSKFSITGDLESRLPFPSWKMEVIGLNLSITGKKASKSLRTVTIHLFTWRQDQLCNCHYQLQNPEV